MQLHMSQIIGFPRFPPNFHKNSKLLGSLICLQSFKEYFIWICNHLIFEVSVQHTYYNRQTWSQNLCLFDGWWQQCIFHAQLDRLDICNLFRIRRRIDPALFGFIQSVSISWLKNEASSIVAVLYHTSVKLFDIFINGWPTLSQGWVLGIV